MDDAQAVAIIAAVLISKSVLPLSNAQAVGNAVTLLDESRRQLVEARRTDEHEGLCAACKGSGRDPMSDTTNSLPCSSCQGSGKRRQRLERNAHVAEPFRRILSGLGAEAR